MLLYTGCKCFGLFVRKEKPDAQLGTGYDASMCFTLVVAFSAFLRQSSGYERERFYSLRSSVVKGKVALGTAFAKLRLASRVAGCQVKPQPARRVSSQNSRRLPADGEARTEFSELSTDFAKALLRLVPDQLTHTKGIGYNLSVFRPLQTRPSIHLNIVQPTRLLLLMRL